MTSATFIERETHGMTLRRGNRLVIKRFPDSNAAYTYMNKHSTGINDWRISNKGLKAGTYAYAGGKWHNIKNLDATALAHI